MFVNIKNFSLILNGLFSPIPLRLPAVTRAAAACALLVVAPVALSDSRDLVAQALEQIKQERPAAALQLLQPGISTYAGEKEFDYALALALMDTGDNRQAELVFERLLANAPGFHGARLDYARVLVATQQYVKASEQLDTLADSRPPERAASQMDQLRSVISQRTRSARWSRYLQASTAVGYDSNVNSATVVDEFLGFALDASSREQDSDFFDVELAGGAGYVLARGLKLSGRLSYTKRENSQASFVDSDALTAQVRLARTTETDYQQVTLTGYQFDIDGSRNSEGFNLAGIWLRKIAPQWRIGITADAGRINFQETLEVKDVDRYKAGFIGVYSMGDDGQGQWMLKAGAGIDDPRLSESRFEREFIYAGTSLSWRFNPRVRGVLNVDYQSSQFEQVFFEQLYTDRREDDRYRLAASLDWSFRPGWELNHTLSYTQNDTFVDIFAYERFQAMLRLRYTFD